MLALGDEGTTSRSLPSWKYRRTEDQSRVVMACLPLTGSLSQKCGSLSNSRKSYSMLAAAALLVASICVPPVAAAESALVSSTSAPVAKAITSAPGPAPTTSLCATTEPCKCVFPNDTVIDLSALANSDGNARFEHILSVEDFHYYYWNPCNSFTIGNPPQNPPSPTDECRDVAACQNWYEFYSDLGYQDSSTIKYNQDANGFYIYYKGESDQYAPNGRDLYVYLRCDPNAPLAVFEPFGDTIVKFTYMFEVRHSSLCLRTVETIGISVGTIMCISALVLIIVYLVGGVLIMKLYKKSEGVEIIPNYTLWSAIPGLIKDGAFFIRESISGTASKAEYEQL